MARAYSAMDYYFDHLKKTVASAPTGGTEFGEKIKACAEQNISATQEFVRDLSYAKDIQDNSAYGSAEMLGSLVHEHGIEPHVTVFDKSAQQDASHVTTSPMTTRATFTSALTARS